MSMTEQETIATRLAAVRGRIDAAAIRAGRAPEDVTLVAVSKGHPVELARAAVHVGLADLGENHVQEGSAKAGELATDGLQPRWHLLGHLQRNKVRPALEHFSTIHSLDSLRLLERIGELATAPVDVFVEVNVAGEASKFGVAPADAEALVCAAERWPLVTVRGLMTVAPACDDPQEVRPVFRTLATLGRELGLPELSMGMSNDFEVAIEEGATVVRVGSAIFGARTYH